MVLFIKNERGHIMNDKILQTKKAMKQIVNARGLSRVEKYDLVKKKSKVLTKKELHILIKEYRRDYEICHDLIGGIMDMVTTATTGMSLSIAFLAIFFSDKSMSFEQFSVDLYMTLGTFVFLLMIIYAVNIFKTSSISTTKYVLDILEGCNKK
jgi:hypothetical protein